MSRHRRHAAVVGGGLAGITAAVHLAERGVSVTLLEARPRLGGATHSFRRDGLVVDNGQHIFLRCCTTYRDFLNRLGVSERVVLQDRFDVTVLGPNGERGRLRRSRLPGHLQFATTLAGYGLVSPADRFRAVRAVRALGTLDHDDPALDRMSFGSWLSGQAQSRDAVRRLWELFIVAGLNAPAGRASAGLATMMLQTALLGERGAADIGVPAVPLSELHGNPAGRLLDRLGARVRTKSKVTAVRPAGSGPAGGFIVTEGGTDLPADAVVLAVPPESAAALVPTEEVPNAATFVQLGSSPIVNVHVIFDRPVMTLPFLAAVDSPVQWIFDRTHIAGLDHGQYLALSVSAADRYIDLPTRELRAVFLPALRRLLPAAREAGVREFFVTRERRATFRQSPGTQVLRPGTTTRLPGLFLAGAWTDTGWPDTMEGAVRSGLVAARHAGEHLHGSLASLPSEAAV